MVLFVIRDCLLFLFLINMPSLFCFRFTLLFSSLIPGILKHLPSTLHVSYLKYFTAEVLIVGQLLVVCGETCFS